MKKCMKGRLRFLVINHIFGGIPRLQRMLASNLDRKPAVTRESCVFFLFFSKLKGAAPTLAISVRCKSIGWI